MKEYEKKSWEMNKKMVEDDKEEEQMRKIQ
jgi:hypothetical protein